VSPRPQRNHSETSKLVIPVGIFRRMYDLIQMPIGSFTKQHFDIARSAIDVLQKLKIIYPISNQNQHGAGRRGRQNKKEHFYYYNNDEAQERNKAIALSIQLYERLLYEILSLHEKIQLEPNDYQNFIAMELAGRFVFEPAYSYTIFHLWKEASRHQKQLHATTNALLSASDMWTKLQQWHRDLTSSSSSSEQQPRRLLLAWDAMILGMIIDVMAIQFDTSSGEYATAAEDVLNFAKRETAKLFPSDNSNNNDDNMNKNNTNSNRSKIAPNAFIYSRVLQAHATSSRSDAGDKMDALIQDMKTNNVPRTVLLYNILLRYHAGRRDVTKMEELFETMRQDQVEPDIVSYSQKVYAYAKTNDLSTAEKILLENMIFVSPGDAREIRIIQESVQHLFQQYRSIIDSFNSSLSDQPEVNLEKKEWAVTAAENVWKQIENRLFFDQDTGNKVRGAMLDIFVRAGKFEKAQDIFQRIKPTNVNCNIMIKAYGELDQAEKGNELLTSMLQSTIVHPCTMTFNHLINAWEKSSRKDRVEQAFRVFQIMKEDAKCIDLGVVPDAVTYTALFKVLLHQRKTSKTGALQANELLDEMYMSHKAGYIERGPGKFEFGVAIRMLLGTGHLKEAHTLMERAESMGAPVDKRTYVMFLSHWSKDADTGAAIRAENLLASMMKRSKTDDPSVRPDTLCYKLVMDAWSNQVRSTFGEQKIALHVWNLYQEMIREGVKVDGPCFTRTIYCLSNDTSDYKYKMLERAENVILSMENGEDAKHLLRSTHYDHVISGWIRLTNAARAERLFLRQSETYIRLRNPNVLPSHRIADELLQCWIQNDELLCANEFLEKLQALQEIHELPGPDPLMYEKLLKAWSMSELSDKETMVQKLELQLSKLKNLNHEEDSP
jgi:pentatricopeptide repeat protein